jgi:hypothetical protein
MIKVSAQAELSHANTLSNEENKEKLVITAIVQIQVYIVAAIRGCLTLPCS